MFCWVVGGVGSVWKGALLCAADEDVVEGDVDWREMGLASFLILGLVWVGLVSWAGLDGWVGVPYSRQADGKQRRVGLTK